MIPSSLAHNPYMNEASFQDQPRTRFSSVGSQSNRPMSYTTGTFYKQYPMSTGIEEPYHSVQFQRLTAANSELEIRCSQLIKDCKLLQDENTNLTSQLQRYASTLQKMYRLHNEQQHIIGRLRSHELETGEYSEALNRRNLELNNEIQNLALDRQLLAYRLNEQDLRAHRDKQMLGARLHDKTQQTFQLRKRFNNVLDAKTKLEEEVSALRFTLDNFKSKAALELRQKCLRLQNCQRTFNDTLTAKNEEIRHLNDKVKHAEEEARKLRESNTLLLTKADVGRLDNVSRIYPHQLQSHMKTGGKQNKDTLNRNQRDRNDRHHDNLDAQSKIHGLLTEKDKMLEQKQSEVQELQSRLKKMESKMSEASLEKRRPNIFQSDNDARIINSLMHTVDKLRQGINKQVFQKFVMSVNSADERKVNSLMIFMSNLNDFVSRQGKLIKPSIEGYYEARDGLKEFLEREHLPPQQREKLVIAVGKLVKYENDFRDKLNKWIEGTLVYTIEQKELDKSEKNKEIMFLFRLLTIKYRILYPIRCKSFTVDADLKAVLEHKIVQSIKQILAVKMI